ncbi:hypothetical protein CEXT_368851 [Caerostris extrusa]|uniref:Uncharacterized protein n=1 Tax=Caerostris extrusa TaxID=172846 RepID=A0AAV4Q400_CAEEX|nr:hypothetical protein CEXT_368851 [Caerostris extrusa]
MALIENPRARKSETRDKCKRHFRRQTKSNARHLPVGRAIKRTEFDKEEKEEKKIIIKGRKGCFDAEEWCWHVCGCKGAEEAPPPTPHCPIA